MNFSKKLCKKMFGWFYSVKWNKLKTSDSMNWYCSRFALFKDYEVEIWRGRMLQTAQVIRGKTRKNKKSNSKNSLENQIFMDKKLMAARASRVSWGKLQSVAAIIRFSQAKKPYT